MKIYRKANQINENLPEGTIILSDLYRREGNIKILDRFEEQDPFSGTKIKYKALFTGSGREGFIEPRDITSIVA